QGLSRGARRGRDEARIPRVEGRMSTRNHNRIMIGAGALLAAALLAHLLGLAAEGNPLLPRLRDGALAVAALTALLPIAQRACKRRGLGRSRSNSSSPSPASAAPSSGRSWRPAASPFPSCSAPAPKPAA